MHVLGLRCEPIPLVRIGLVGLGRRGMKTLNRYGYIKNAEIRCVCDLNEEQAVGVKETLNSRQGSDSCTALWGEEAWHELCLRKDIDLVYICTDWSTHTEMAVEAMRHGKHVAVEVPAATKVDECWQLVKTAEETRRHCFITENCCYDFFTLSTLEMLAAGALGDIVHCEGAYIHKMGGVGVRKGGGADAGRWMEDCCARHGGNPYPTHGLGPIGWLLNLHRGDRMDYLVSMSSQVPHREGGLFGSINSTLIRTVKGRSILLIFDVTTLRPYSRLQTVCGTHGFLQKYPLPTVQIAELPDALTGDDALAMLTEKFSSGEASRIWQEGHAMGVPNEMNYTMDCRLIHCLRHGLPLDIDVYDAAEWSCIAELSQISVREGSKPVPIPDFTQGNWQVLPGFRMHF